MTRRSVSLIHSSRAAFAQSEGSASAFDAHAGFDQATASVGPVRRLIVNADDFGISEEVNDAIIRAHREGVLTSTSLMVTGAAAAQAVRLAKENPGLAVGIHLVAVMGRSVLPKSEIPSLVDEQQNFSNNPTAAGLKYFFSPPARREIRREIAAQFARFHETGLRLSHVDGHLHLHVHPVIFNEALRQAIKYGARRMRVPEEERAVALGYDSTHRAQKTFFTIQFGGLARYMKRKLRNAGFTVPERVYGNLQSGRMSESYFLYILDHLRATTSEIYFHPAVYPSDRALDADEQQCQLEFETLISERVRERLTQTGIQLTNYIEMEAQR
jgi:hopanoid biosynthesis associated protein HpnK